jgi:hypothetical protein
MPAGPVALFKQGCFDADAVNALNSLFTGIAAGTIGLNAPTSLNATNFNSLLVNGAIPITNPLTPTVFQINKAGVLADTLAAPVAGTDDGKFIWVVSNTANAHTVTATGLFQVGAAPVNLATFAAFAGAGFVAMAFNAKWVVQSQMGITFT